MLTTTLWVRNYDYPNFTVKDQRGYFACPRSHSLVMVQLLEYLARPAGPPTPFAAPFSLSAVLDTRQVKWLHRFL